MRKLFILFVLLTATAVQAQEVMLEKVVVPDTARPAYGPNAPNFVHFFVGVGGFLDEVQGTGAEVDNARSSDVAFGLRYKHQFVPAWSIGGDLTYNRQVFRIMQRAGKTFPNKKSHEKERLTLSNFSLSFYNRITYGKRGNRMGNYVDIGGYVDARIGGLHYFRDEHDPVNFVGAKVTETTNRRLQWLEPFNYGLLTRFGRGRFVFWGKYRLSDLFIRGYGYPELSRVSAGVELGLF